MRLRTEGIKLRKSFLIEIYIIRIDIAIEEVLSCLIQD